jgi:hypothetical protein
MESSLQREYVIEFTGADFDQVSLVIPAGSVVVENTYVQVVEAGVMTGTTPTIDVGVVGSEDTNYLASISEAQAEAAGHYSDASAGTLAVDTPLAADVTIGVALGGTTPALAGGKFKLVAMVRKA